MYSVDCRVVIRVPSDKVSTIDLSAWFSGYEGSFVLYDLNGDTWNVYDMEQATLRTAPNSTYKIYDALFGLEEGVIAPDDSFMAWDGTNHPFEAWNRNQDLFSAMQSSVNWYFEEIDRQIGSSAIQGYIRKSDTEYLAKCYGTIVYEVLTGFNGRAQRIYV